MEQQAKEGAAQAAAQDEEARRRQTQSEISAYLSHSEPRRIQSSEQEVLRLQTLSPTPPSALPPSTLPPPPLSAPSPPTQSPPSPLPPTSPSPTVTVGRWSLPPASTPSPVRPRRSSMSYAIAVMVRQAVQVAPCHTKRAMLVRQAAQEC